MLQQLVSNLPFLVEHTRLFGRRQWTHIIKSPRITLRSINTNPRTPTNKEIPLVTRGMPMDLPQRPRFHRDHRSTELTRDREDCWIDHFYSSAGCFVVVGFFGEVVGVG